MVDSSGASAQEPNKALHMVRELLEERKEVLVRFNELAGTTPYPAKPSGNGGERAIQLQNFCQLLVDYVASGHFGLYEALRSEGDCQDTMWNLAERIYPRISATTDTLMRFNDKYNCADFCEIGDDLGNDLSAAGEALATRIELEDQVIGPLCEGCATCLPDEA
ncbi:MAG TPA: Rsd/AlgQ family anti-sigma factor [Gammaproteobacteria bacterium]